MVSPRSTRLRTGLGSILVVTALLAALAAGACSASPAAPAASLDGGGNASADTGSSSPASDAGAETSVDEGSASTQTLLRIANVSPDAPALDVCVAPHGTTAFQGPLLAQFMAGLVGSDAGDAATPADGGAVGVAYGQVSAYIPLSPGQYDVRLVAAGAVSCDLAEALTRPFDDGDAGEGGADAALDASDAGADAGAPADAGFSDSGSEDAGVDGATDASAAADATADARSGGPEWTQLPALAAGANVTLLVAGDFFPAATDAPLTVTILPDDGVLTGGAAELRVINALPSYPAIDLGLSSSAPWLAVFTDVRFATATAQTSAGNDSVNANGYLPIGPLSAQAMSVRASASDAGVDLAAASNVEIDQGTIATVIAIGGKTGDSTNPPALLLCNDNQPAGGIFADCSLAH